MTTYQDQPKVVLQGESVGLTGYSTGAFGGEGRVSSRY